MSRPPKVHVFLGAPPPPSCPTLEAGVEAEQRPPADWRHLELRWMEGRLRPETEAAEGRGGSSSDDPPGGDEYPSSVEEYLDVCFPDKPPEPPSSSPPAATPLSVHTHYLTTWTLSQALVLRSRHGIRSATSPEKNLPKANQTPPSASSSTPELFSPAPLSQGASAELLSPPCPSQRMEEGGVVIEDTSDGVVCSQEIQEQESTPGHASPSTSPRCKTARISAQLGTEAPLRPTESPATARLWGPTTLLTRCSRQGAQYSVLVAVVHPSHLKEIKLKSGPAAGSLVPLASIVVTDQSGVEMKVVLWRRAAFWVLTVRPGDVLLITGLRVNEDRWRGETVLQSTFNSKLVNLGQVSASNTPAAPQQVHAGSLGSLYAFLRERRPLLVCLNTSPPQDLSRLPYATLRTARVNTLVHALLRVTHTHLSTAWRSEAESRCRSAVQRKAVLTVEQPGGQQGALLLWGAAVDWLPRFNKDKVTVWDFRFLLVRDESTADVPELHSTPWSAVRPLEPTSQQAQDFLWPRAAVVGNGSCLELDVDTLLSQRYSGNVELRVQVVAFRFQDSLPSQNAPQPVMDSSTPSDGIVAVLGGDITYSGCGRCSTELDTDANGIYVPCYRCLPHTTVRRYYRSAGLTVSTPASSQVFVQVPPGPLQKILQAPPDKLHQSSAPGSEVKHIQVAAERIQTLLSLPRKTFIISIRSHFLCDENSVPINQEFTLLELQFPS